ncbi:DNA/RNA helicase domain-containing protein [Streptomyces sp. NPDC087850]|uniref:DNA/RNA helicase domain-containing protein n=1 Tax=Streptomyces sp. NPDC087850 TaxID=3365809 RepID=UPI00380E2039
MATATTDASSPTLMVECQLPGVGGAPMVECQVGYIYTAQGFEYDWNGVSIGPDLIWRSGTWIGTKSASKDTVVAQAQREEFEHLIRNTYKVLLTRGMIGTILFSSDPETRQCCVTSSPSRSCQRLAVRDSRP